MGSAKKTSQQEPPPPTEQQYEDMLLLDQFIWLRAQNIFIAFRMANEGLGWEDICWGTDLGEEDARRIVWRVHAERGRQ